MAANCLCMPKLTVQVKYGSTEIHDFVGETTDSLAQKQAMAQLELALARCVYEPELFETVYRV